MALCNGESKVSMFAGSSAASNRWMNTVSFALRARSPPWVFWMPFERGSVLGIVPGYGLCRFGETCSFPLQGDMPVDFSFREKTHRQ